MSLLVAGLGAVTAGAEGKEGATEGTAGVRAEAGGGMRLPCPPPGRTGAALAAAAARAALSGGGGVFAGAVVRITVPEAGMACGSRVGGVLPVESGTTSA